MAAIVLPVPLGPKKSRHAPAIRQLIAELPTVEDSGREPDVVYYLDELSLLIDRQDNVIEVEDGIDAIGELRYALGRHLLAGCCEPRQLEIIDVVVLRPRARERHRLLEGVQVQRKVPHDGCRRVFGLRLVPASPAPSGARAYVAVTSLRTCFFAPGISFDFGRRPVVDAAAQDRIRDLVLQAYAEHCAGAARD
jgi:hypothetical protein